MLQQQQSVGIVAGLVLVTSTVMMSNSLAPLSRMLRVPAAPADDVTASIALRASCVAREPSPLMRDVAPMSERMATRLAACETRHSRRDIEACRTSLICAAGTPPVPRS